MTTLLVYIFLFSFAELVAMLLIFKLLIRPVLKLMRRAMMA